MRLLAPQFGNTRPEPGTPGGRKLRLRYHGYVPREYSEVAREAEEAFPEAARRLFHAEGVTMVLTGNRRGALPPLDVSPFEYKTGNLAEKKAVYMSPNTSSQPDGNGWMSRERFFHVVVQSLAQVLRASTVEMLFDEKIPTAFEDDSRRLDHRIAMFVVGMGGTQNVTDFRARMARDGADMKTMFEAVGYCIAEYCTGESLLDDTFPEINRPAASLFPQLYAAVEKHMPPQDSLSTRFYQHNPGLKDKLAEPEQALIENLINDPVTPLHSDGELQKKYADFAGRTMGVLMESVDDPDRRREQFVKPFQEIRDQVWGLWRKLEENETAMSSIEAMKIVSCLDRTDMLLDVLKAEVPKEDRYPNGETMDLFASMWREFKANHGGEYNVLRYVVTVLAALPGFEGQDGANRLTRPLDEAAMRLLASGDQVSARAAQTLETLLTQRLSARDAEA